MSKRIEDLIEAAAELSRADRAALVEALLQSLRQTTPDIDRAWVEEAERRLADWRAGRCEAVDAHSLLADLRQRPA